MSKVLYGCKYAPVELLAGFGAEPQLMMDEPEAFDVAETLAHSNLCGYGKAVLAQALRPDVHEMVLTTCCDVMRRVADVLAEQEALDFLWLVDVPRKTEERERAMFADELRRLAVAYSDYTGISFDVGRALAAVMRPSTPSELAVSLVGAHAPQSLIDELAADVSLPTVNHTCTGERILANPPLELTRPAPQGCGVCPSDAKEQPSAAADDPLETFISWYAGALLDQPPCMRMVETGGRTGFIGADSPGIIYHTMKFCDFYGFEYADLAAQAQVPVLKIETDGTRQSAGQLRTRIQAFDETVRVQTGGSAHEVGSEPSERGAAVQQGGSYYVLGIDSGSTSTDAVLIDEQGDICASVILPTGAKASVAADRAIEEVCAQAAVGRSDVARIVATGYGRDAITSADEAITEISCHAAGAHALMPEVRTVIDIGGQDSKVIHLASDGAVSNFVMNDKCAAGTGRFLEMMARTLELPLEELSRLGLEWKKRVTISSMCTVFAESEVVSLVAADTPTPDIIHGLDVSVATKTAALAKRVGAEPPYLMTGGVANNQGVVEALAEALGAPIATHPSSQLTGAIGAAMLGLNALRSA